jgi:hypothetical protein
MCLFPFGNIQRFIFFFHLSSLSLPDRQTDRDIFSVYEAASPYYCRFFPPGASFFEKKLDQKTLHRFFQGFPSALERGTKSLSLFVPVLTKGASVYFAVPSLV